MALYRAQQRRHDHSAICSPARGLVVVRTCVRPTTIAQLVDQPRETHALRPGQRYADACWPKAEPWATVIEAPAVARSCTDSVNVIDFEDSFAEPHGLWMSKDWLLSL